MLKSFPIFKMNGAHLVEKKTFEKNKDYPLSRFECFEHAKIFLIWSNFENVILQLMENIPKNYENPNYYVSLVIFQTYKNVVLKSVHSFGWLFLL
jgi:hypothetical protein